MLKIDLTGKTALVTGASGQLGRVIAPTLADCGADVAVHYHKNREGAERVLPEVAAYETGDASSEDATTVTARRLR